MMRTILVVDDMALIRDPIAASLQMAGYHAITAANGQEAMEKIAQELPDLILLDLAMPVMDGLAMLQTLRTNPATRCIPVILLTALSDKRYVLQAAKLGVESYLLKSQFSLNDLLQRVKKHLHKSEPAARPIPTADISPRGSAGPAVAGRAVTPTCSVPPVAPQSPVVRGPARAGSSAAGTESSLRRPFNPAGADGGHLDALRSLQPIVTRADLMARIDESGEMKGFSPAVTELIRLTGNAQCPVERVAKAISQDHGIALKILRLANSVVYTRGEPIDSVVKAVLRIGMSQIRQAVLNIAVVEHFSHGIEGFINSSQFWEHAMATGIICSEIARSRDEKEADSAFTMGLLHDVGRMAYISQLQDAYRQVLQTSRENELLLEQVEQRMLGLNHADVMERVFRAWNFPKQFTKPIAGHHLSAGNVRNTETQEAIEIATLALANRLAHAFMLGSSGNEAIYPTEDFCELLRLDPSVIGHIEQTVRDETDTVKFALLANSRQDNWDSLQEVHRRSLAEPLRPLYVSSSPQIDAHRIFCDQLADWSENSTPNLGVIFIRQVRDQDSLTEQYREKEEASGVNDLPLLVISPSGKALPDSSLFAGRRVTALATPFPISRFIAIVNRLMAANDPVGESVAAGCRAA